MATIRPPRLRSTGITVFEVRQLDRRVPHHLVLTGPPGFGPVDQQTGPGQGSTSLRTNLSAAPSGMYTLVTNEVRNGRDVPVAERSFHVVGATSAANPAPPATRVQLQRTAVVPTDDGVLTDEILRLTRARRFSDYQRAVDAALLKETGGAFSPQAYEVIAKATRTFLERDTTTILDIAGTYLDNGNLPYLENIARRYPDARGGTGNDRRVSDIDEKLLDHPAPVELIWSYWNEEAGVVQTMNHILARFQNRRIYSGDERLARFRLSYLRPLRNILYTWGDHEIDRLTVRRRAAEYQYEYGLDIIGRAVPESLRYVERRSRFLESFHTLLHEALVFNRLDDDTTVVANAFPVLNALRDTHQVLAEGAENQFDGVALQARSEMLAMQYLLAQPEIRDYLGGRPMVPYEEPWMDRVDTMRSLYGWGDASVTHFHELAVHGEELVMTVRWGHWSAVGLAADSAANWARTMRPAVERYVHAYRAVTGVDLQLGVDATMPGLLLERRRRERARA